MLHWLATPLPTVLAWLGLHDNPRFIEYIQWFLLLWLIATVTLSVYLRRPKDRNQKYIWFKPRDAALVFAPREQYQKYHRKAAQCLDLMAKEALEKSAWDSFRAANESVLNVSQIAAQNTALFQKASIAGVRRGACELELERIYWSLVEGIKKDLLLGALVARGTQLGLDVDDEIPRLQWKGLKLNLDESKAAGGDIQYYGLVITSKTTKFISIQDAASIVYRRSHKAFESSWAIANAENDPVKILDEVYKSVSLASIPVFGKEPLEEEPVIIRPKILGDHSKAFRGNDFFNDNDGHPIYTDVRIKRDDIEVVIAELEGTNQVSPTS